MKVYLDIFYVTNFFLNLLVLAVQNIFLKKTSVSLRTIWSSLTGATFAVLVVVCSIKNYLVLFLVMYIVVSGLMVRIAYGKMTFLGMIRRVLGFYGAGVFVSGGVLYLKSLIGITDLPLIFLLVTAILLVCIVQKIYSSLKQEVTKARGIFPVRITYNGKSVSGTAFLDTGNHLYEPISQEPVSIIEYKLFRGMLSDEQNADFTQAIHNMEPELFGRLLLRYIPYHSLGMKGNYILGVRVEDMEIQVDESKTIHTGRTWLGICEDFLSSDSEYEVLLNSKIISK